MEKDDVGIDDTGKKDHDSEGNIEELESKALDSKVESTKEEGENLPCMIADAGNANKSDDHVGHCVNEMEKDLDDIKNNEKTDKIVAQTETEEPMVVEGSTSQIDVVNMNKEKSSPTSNVDLQPINKQSDAENKVTEHTEISYQNADTDSDPKKTQIPVDVPPNEDPGSENAKIDKVMLGGYEEMEVASNLNEEKAVNNELTDTGKEIHLSTLVADENTKMIETATKHTGDHHSLTIKHEAVTPSSIVRCFPKTAGDESGETGKTLFTQAALPMMAEDDDGTPEEQATFMKEIESFYRERATDFKPPKFYGQPLNCLKLWRAVIRLGGYERVTGSKLWRQVGESFHPPKTCTTVSWTFRIFYEKSLLEYEKNKTQSGELQLPVAALNDASGADTEGNGLQGTGSGRARRDAASRAMQGWHGQRLFGHGEVGEPLVKEKSISNMAKREKIVKTIGSLKQKRPNEVEHPVKAARVDSSKQLETTVVDIGPPADWVKINVRQTNDSFEVYALVPGLLREEVRVQSDPAGRLVITGQPEQVDNPWGITPFKKVISLPSRIDPLQTSAVVSLHGRLFVRVPFEQSNG